MSLARQIAETAASRENLVRGIQAARQCGNYEWAKENERILDLYNEHLKELTDKATEYDIVEAMELTNARPIRPF